MRNLECLHFDHSISGNFMCDTDTFLDQRVILPKLNFKQKLYDPLDFCPAGEIHGVLLLMSMLLSVMVLILTDCIMALRQHVSDRRHQFGHVGESILMCRVSVEYLLHT